MEIEVQSVINKNFKMSMDALIVSSIMQPRKIDSNNENNWPHLNKLTLADPEFLNPNKIDLLFGVDIDALITIDGLRKGKTNEPIAQNSVLGWLVFGAISKKKQFWRTHSHNHAKRTNIRAIASILGKRRGRIETNSLKRA